MDRGGERVGEGVAKEEARKVRARAPWRACHLGLECNKVTVASQKRNRRSRSAAGDLPRRCLFWALAGHDRNPVREHLRQDTHQSDSNRNCFRVVTYYDIHSIDIFVVFLYLQEPSNLLNVDPILPCKIRKEDRVVVCQRINVCHPLAESTILTSPPNSSFVCQRGCPLFHLYLGWIASTICLELFLQRRNLLSRLRNLLKGVCSCYL